MEEEAENQPGNRMSGTGGGLTSTKDDNSVASESSGFGSLTKKKSGSQGGGEVPPVIGLGLVDGTTTTTETHFSAAVTADALVECMTSTLPDTIQSGVSSLSNPMLSSTDHGHSRNSSNTSQVSKSNRSGPSQSIYFFKLPFIDE